MPSSSLFLRSSTTLVTALSLFSASVSAASSTYYALDTEYSGATFFDGFTFQDTADLSHGFVTYVSEPVALRSGLITFNDDSVQMRVDSSHTYDGTADYWLINGVGRPSVRIQSTEAWTHGLFIADIKHMPTTATTSGCGTWPAFWTLGDGTWPDNGEIDIVEGANNQGANLVAAHTGNTCVIPQSPLQMTGTSNGNDCEYYSATGSNGAGCAAFDPRDYSYGAPFNAINGGVFAMEWTSEAIKVWFFPRGGIPADIEAGTPDPSLWGLPVSIVNGPNCDIDADFANHRIVFDTTFCGDFGDATWTTQGCAAITSQSTCSVFVGDNPDEFVDAYWDVNYVKVYQTQSVVTTTTTSTTSTTSATTTTSAYATTTTTASTLSSTTTTSAASSTTTTINTIGPVGGSTTASTTPAAVASSTTSAYVSPAPVSTTTSFQSIAPFLNTTTTTTSAVTVGPIGGETTTTTTLNTVGPIGGVTTTTSSLTTATGSATTPAFAWDDWLSNALASTSTTSASTSSASTYAWEDWPTTVTIPIEPESTTSAETWNDWTDVTITLTKTWIVPCSTGYATETITVVTTHCGCTETPVPTIPVTVTTITPSPGWPVTTPVVCTVPVAVAVPGTASTTPAVATATATGTAITITESGSGEAWPSSPAEVVSTISSGAAGSWSESGSASSSPVEVTLTLASVVASSSATDVPLVTLATTLTVEPVKSGATPVSTASASASGTTTNPWVASYTGAAGRMELSTIVVFAAGVLALAVAGL